MHTIHRISTHDPHPPPCISQPSLTLKFPPSSLHHAQNPPPAPSLAENATCVPKDEQRKERERSTRSTPSTPANSARMCTLAPAALEKQRAPMAIVKERIAQRRAASGSARKHARSVRLPRSGCRPRVHTRRYRPCRREMGSIIGIYVEVEEGGRESTSTRTHRFVVICVGASAMSPYVVYADDHGEHGKENGAKARQFAEGY